MGRAFEVRKQAMMKTQAHKSKLYAKYGKEIYMAAKAGTDPNSNPALKRIIERAKRDQVTNDIINRAIDRAKGGGNESYQEARYEGFGPNGSLFIIECLTDNVNRTIHEVRNCFTKTNGKLGVSGSVIHQFEYLSVFEVEKEEEALLEALLENDISITDIEPNGQTTIVYGESASYNDIRTFLQDKEYEIVLEELSWLPLTTVTLDNEEDKETVNKLLNMLDEVEDVSNVFHNIDL